MKEYEYCSTEAFEPDWTRFPGWRDVDTSQWRSARWQRANTVFSVKRLHEVLGGLLSDGIYREITEDQELNATMPLRITPHMLNTMVPDLAPHSPEFRERFRTDPVRRYMLVLSSDRVKERMSHPMAQRDSLHEAKMWVVEGMTHRYPTKVLAELTSTCPQYCGHCTRMDLVGASTQQVEKRPFAERSGLRLTRMLQELRSNPRIRDVVVSGGDVANVPWPRLEQFVADCIAIDSVKDIRLASKSLVGMPQHWLQPQVLRGVERLARLARERHVSLALHTHANAAQSVSRLVAEASHALLNAGLRDVRNQAVLLAGVNDSRDAVLDLSFGLLDRAGITPYYMYLCDMIPAAEHWRTSLRQAVDLQDRIMGYLPGFATPRIVCDVPLLGKRWVHQYRRYDETTGISSWAGERGDEFRYYDPLHLLPEEGRAWWRQKATGAVPALAGTAG
ncbi:KamA family radical SAM protein [Streptomyces sp. NPDC018045]|uniref:KamA family radical SAM protein n=1 Tax=Streptomyces sp. NPDC018045 TaxID=3365037 RepID=UPI0037B51040